MQYHIPIPETFPLLTVKALLEDYFLIPRKIRHFLRVKKHVRINGDLVNWQSQVKPFDILTLTFDAQDYPDKTLPPGNPSLADVLYEDEHLIIVNKAEGMKTHANAPNEIALLNHVSTYVGKTCYVVHRLDKETSGVILFAKNPFILPILNRLLERRQVSRTYRALCQGSIDQEEWHINDRIGQHRHDRRKRLVDNHKGQEAETQVYLEKQVAGTSLVSCQLKTGRTHQIRVHLAHHGHAIIGDPLYSKKAAPRLMLHAYQLQLTHPLTLETIRVTVDSQSFQEQVMTLTNTD